MRDIWQISTLKKGDLTLHILPGIGGRLWDIVYKDQSLLFQNSDLSEQIPNLESLKNLPTRSPQFGFPLWGGEKTWIAPDHLWTDGAPYPVLDSGAYDILQESRQKIMMQSQICDSSQLQIERCIKLDDNNDICITHKVTNQGDNERLTGIWSVLMLNHPAQIALTNNNPKVTPVFGTPDGYYHCNNTSVVCSCKEMAEYKIGTDNSNGKVVMKLADKDNPVWLVCTSEQHSQNNEYAHEHSFEVFNSGDYPYCEAEWHAPVRKLKPGESAVFEQRFTCWLDKHMPDNPALSQNEMELISCMS